MRVNISRHKYLVGNEIVHRHSSTDRIVVTSAVAFADHRVHMIGGCNKQSNNELQGVNLLRTPELSHADYNSELNCRETDQLFHSIVITMEWDNLFVSRQ